MKSLAKMSVREELVALGYRRRKGEAEGLQHRDDRARHARQDKKLLTDGLQVGNEISVITDERKYLLQKSMGLWFHVIAAEGEGE
jgi:hypothetical protein